MSKKSESTIRKRKISSSETSSTSTTKKASSSGNSTNAVNNLTPSSYQALSTTFNKLSDSRKWKLEDGVYVEDLLYDYANQEKMKSNNVLQPLFKLFTNLILFLAYLILKISTLIRYLVYVLLKLVI
jgi:signal transduction histidine kinase